MSKKLPKGKARKSKLIYALQPGRILITNSSPWSSEVTSRSMFLDYKPFHRRFRQFDCNEDNASRQKKRTKKASEKLCALARKSKLAQTQARWRGWAKPDGYWTACFIYHVVRVLSAQCHMRNTKWIVAMQTCVQTRDHLMASVRSVTMYLVTASATIGRQLSSCRSDSPT